MHVIEVREGDLIEEITRQAKELGIKDAAIVSLIGAADFFTVSAMPRDDATRDALRPTATFPGEMTGGGEIVNGKPHVHAMFAIDGDEINGGKVIGGHVHNASIFTWFARAYVLPVTR